MRSTDNCLPGPGAWTLGLALAASSAALCAQGVIRQVLGQQESAQLGASVALLADLDGDGRPEFVAGAPSEDGPFPDTGVVRVWSGANGALLHSWSGPRTEAFLGTSVANAGDVDGDGFADVVAGAPHELVNGPDPGRVFVWSGRTGAELWRFAGDSAGEGMGISVGGGGDVDGDGYDDLVAGAPYNDVGGTNTGLARVWSGRTGQVLWSFPGAASTRYTARAATIAGDVDRDGFADVLVDDRLAERVRVHSGRTGAVLWTFAPSTSGGGFGTSVAGNVDIDDDGHCDILVGAPLDDGAGPDAGAAFVFSGRTGLRLLELRLGMAGDGFGAAVSGAGDVDGDGIDDLLIGAPSAGATDLGAVFVVSGRSAALLATWPGTQADERLGDALAGFQDLDDDGFDDVAIGSPRDSSVFHWSGKVTIRDLGAQGSPARARRIGTACAGSDARLPVIDAPRRPFVGRNLTLGLRGARSLVPVLLNLGWPTDLPLDALGMTGCRLYASVDLFAFGFTSNAWGMVACVDLPVPNDTALVGTVLGAQAVCWAPGANALGITASNGLRLTIGS